MVVVVFVSHWNPDVPGGQQHFWSKHVPEEEKQGFKLHTDTYNFTFILMANFLPKFSKDLCIHYVQIGRKLIVLLMFKKKTTNVFVDIIIVLVNDPQIHFKMYYLHSNNRNLLDIGHPWYLDRKHIYIGFHS